MALLVMTATIRPPSNAPQLTRTDAEARLADYRRGLQHNLALLRKRVVSGIVFVDNSAYGTERLEDIVAGAEDLRGRIELISYDARLGEMQQSRFAGECKLLAHAFDSSALIRGSDDAHVWKVTGRYVVRNLGAIIAADYGRADLIVHCRNRPKRFVDFGVAGFARTRAAEIMGRVLASPHLEYRDEAVIREGVDGAMFADLQVARRFAEIPDFSGVRGSDSASYDGSLYRMKYLARVTANRVFPQLWI